MKEFVGGDGAPDFEGAREHLLGYLVSFTRTLRRAGADVPANASVVAARALVELGLDDRDAVRSALRSSLISRAEDRDVFDRLFPSFWRQLIGEDDDYVAPEQASDSPVTDTRQPPGEDVESRTEADSTPGGADLASVERAVEPGGQIEADASDGSAETAAVYSPSGGSRRVAVPQRLDADDHLPAAVRRLTDAIASQRGRRWARDGVDRVDTRRALRQSIATGGAVLSVPRRDRQRSAVRATVLVDVSQSVLDTVDRDFLLRFLRLARAEWRDSRIFFFDTSVREVTRSFDAPSTAAAAAALERVEAEWGGGTRIGNAFETVRRRHPGAVDRETIVFVISDGLEVGELEVLEAGTSWISRRARVVLWLNPLAVSSAYEPTCRGMALALPYLDGLFAFAGPDDVDEVARQLERRGFGDRLGYEYDPRRRVDGQ